MSGNNSTRLSQLQPKLYADASDQLVAYSNISSNDVLISVSNLYYNTTLYVNKVVLLQNNTPANSSINSITNNIWSDGNYIYVATGNNSVKRVALTSF
jgi:hypothetical protein